MRPKNIKYYTFIAMGMGASALGIIGAFVPLLPTVPFALLALYCFGVSSPKCQQWLLNNKYLGPTLKNIKEKKGLSVYEKTRILGLVWASILITVFWVVNERPSAQYLLVAIAVIETYVIVRYKTRRDHPQQ
ncbi:YbaN family protein [Vibrio sonorensis]|uniref:YbaN family protein n=1 Tax=Vibrio sonorensis TaxID=1004316 RepID=UPI0009FBF74A|nr:YbaN family protein [Vibrio sonorensis]